jgi:hypothetical protein
MKSAKWMVVLIFVMAGSMLAQAQNRWSFRGTVVRMQMADCVAQHGFMAAMSGVPAPAGIQCPSYTVVSNKVVYLVVGRHSEEYIPLAEELDFLVRKNELVLFSDDEKSRSRFTIQQMTLRSEWEREKSHHEMIQQAMEHMDSERGRPRMAVITESR